MGVVGRKDFADWELAPRPRRPNLERMAAEHAKSPDGTCNAGCTYGENIRYEHPCPTAKFALLELELLDDE